MSKLRKCCFNEEVGQSLVRSRRVWEVRRNRGTSGKAISGAGMTLLWGMGNPTPLLPARNLDVMACWTTAVLGPQGGGGLEASVPAP